MQHIRDFHIKHDYIVKVRGLESRPGCMVSYPANRFGQFPAIQRTYMVFADPCGLEIYTILDGRESQSNVIEAVKCNVRLLVVQDVFLTAHKRGISKELILAEDGKTLFKMLEIPQTEEEKSIETQLCVRFRALLAGDVVSTDIEGYEQVLSCFENGGL